jgi:hypothetical protein
MVLLYAELPQITNEGKQKLNIILSKKENMFCVRICPDFAISRTITN